jgi:hypothetical protein
MSRIFSSLATHFLIAALLLLMGCAHGVRTTCKPLATDTLKLIRGVSTSDDVLNALGPPLQVASIPCGYAFLYESIHSSEFQLGLINNIPYLQWFKVISSSAEYDHQVLLLLFNHDHRLLLHQGKNTPMDLGDAFAVQTINSVDSLFDVSSVENDRIDISQWGLSLLEPLPVTLNRAQSLDSGLSGFEQRGTPSHTGQRSLELHGDPIP